MYEPVTVLFRATDEDFVRGYALCREAHGRSIFVEEHDFYEQVTLFLEADGYASFLVDDDVFYREFKGEVSLEPDEIALSLRLGCNVQRCYLPQAVAQPQPRDLRALNGRRQLVTWKWSEAILDWGYPCSLDGHVFRSETLRRILDSAEFKNPNTLEDALASRVARAHGERMVCPRESVVVSLPLNQVNETHSNQHSGHPLWSPGELNRCFLAGERLDLEKTFAQVRVTAAHQEIAPRFSPQ